MPVSKILLAFTGCSIAAAATVTVSHREFDSTGSISLVGRQLGVTIPANSCATHLLCCNSLTYASDPSTAAILQLLGINVGGLYTVGLSCSPMSQVGISSIAGCAAEPVCCWWGAEYNYLVAIDCVAVN
ncbi:hypothetical protein BDN70DRAFT_882727 [Pholiota conissans]|uniref:Hydrophobin n=1 Tax=Pholiota conissans TaxID=109636 RepID=A0A9P5YW22_9AGAR|nr:hypothetical protein BDN70DRAFT_882727 [Pholiota conissans]